jgi:hypothetical protein
MSNLLKCLNYHRKPQEQPLQQEIIPLISSSSISIKVFPAGFDVREGAKAELSLQSKIGNKALIDGEQHFLVIRYVQVETYKF